jgi:single-strand DNA-binding protein
MPGYFQQTIIVGAVGRDPEMHTTKGDKEFTTFSVAVTERWRDANGKGNSNNGEYNERTTWYSCSVWERAAQTAFDLIKKGQNIMVIGTVSARGYQGGDGQPKASLDLRVQTFKLLGSRGAGSSRYDDAEDEYEGHPAYGGNSSDDIPF